MPRVLVTLAVALAIAASAPAALACARGYSYAGVYAPRQAPGVAATLSMLAEPSVASGHVAAWVGVGGEGLGPRGTDEWLQVGIASYAGSAEGHLYYEVTQPGRPPQYQELAGGIGPGERVRVALLEPPFPPDMWIVASSEGLARPVFPAEEPGGEGTNRDLRGLGRGREMQPLRLSLPRRSARAPRRAMAA